MRAKYFSAIDRAEYFPDAIFSANSLILVSSNSNDSLSKLSDDEVTAFSVRVNAGSVAAAKPPSKPDFTKPLRDRLPLLFLDILI
jgi:hypothetical protein